MKTKLSIIIILLSYIANLISAQTLNDNYYNKLYYLCKTWGFLKYFHSNVASGNLDWDQILIEKIAETKNLNNINDFSIILNKLIDTAGTTSVPIEDLPTVAEDLKINLNFNWVNDSIYDSSARTKLDNIFQNFRPQMNKYIDYSIAVTNISKVFDLDNKYYNETADVSEEKRLLGLFRFWNIINYFSPHKGLMDQDWDLTLKEFIPRMININNDRDYNMAYKILSTRLNDSHAIIYSSLIDSEIEGIYMFPVRLQYIDDKFTVIEVVEKNTDIKIGDEFLEIDGKSMSEISDSMTNYTIGSNNSSFKRNIADWIVFSTLPNPTEVKIKDKDGERNLVLERIHYTEYLPLYRPAWKKIEYSKGYIGYVDMAVLSVAQVPDMFNELFDTDAIIFDLRNYPNGTLWEIKNYLLKEKKEINIIISPDYYFPGTFTEEITYFEPDFSVSKKYENKIVVLMNEFSQSQSEYTIMGLEASSKAIKVGSQTSGADGAAVRIYLPGEIIIYFTSQNIMYPDGRPTQRIGILPDYEIRPTINGLQEGRDEVLEKAIEISSNTTGIDENSLSINQSFNLSQNYPNPFNPSTTIEYLLPETNYVTLEVYNILGEKISTLISQIQQPGNYRILFDGEKLTTGVYVYALSSGGKKLIRKMVLMK